MEDLEESTVERWEEPISAETGKSEENDRRRVLKLALVGGAGAAAAALAAPALLLGRATAAHPGSSSDDSPFNRFHLGILDTKVNLGMGWLEWAFTETPKQPAILHVRSGRGGATDNAGDTWRQHRNHRSHSRHRWRGPFIWWHRGSRRKQFCRPRWPGRSRSGRWKRGWRGGPGPFDWRLGNQ